MQRSDQALLALIGALQRAIKYFTNTNYLNNSFVRDGRFKVNDEIINVNGSSLRGLTMEAARNILKNTGQNVDIIIARSPELGHQPKQVHKPLSRRKRRLPVIERPKSAPLSGELVTGSLPSNEKVSSDDANYVLDVCDFSKQEGMIKTVIKIPHSSSQSERALPEKEILPRRAHQQPIRSDFDNGGLALPLSFPL